MTLKSFLLTIYFRYRKYRVTTETINIYYGVIIIEYLTTAEISAKWNVSSRTVASYCENQKIAGAIKKGKTWLIPVNAEKPIDKRKRNSNSIEDSIVSISNDTFNDVDLANAENKYYVNDINNFLGISREAIRYYEKQGLIKSTRNEENNYRTFDGFDIFRLMSIDFYKKRGFKNYEIENFFRISNPKELVNSFINKRKEYQELILRFKETVAKLEKTEQFINQINNDLNIFSIKPLPYFSVISTFSSFSAFCEYERKIWTAKDFSDEDILSNMVRIVYFDENGYTGSQMCIIEYNTNKSHTKKDCVHIMVSADNNDNELPNRMFRDCTQWANNNNIALQGTIYIFIRLILFGEDIEHSFYDIYIPIK